MHCPYCGTDKLTETFNFNEHSCDRCGCEFKYDDNSYRIYVEGDYQKFCESILLEMTNNCDVQVGNVLIQVIRECKHYGPEQLDIMIEHIKNVAQSVLSEAQISRRDRYDAEAVIEGLEAFETIGKALIERAEDLNLDMRGFQRYIENIDYKEAILEAANLEERRQAADDEDELPAFIPKGKKAKSDPYAKGKSKPKGKKPSRGGVRADTIDEKVESEEVKSSIDWNKNPVTNEEWEQEAEETEELEEADMSDKDTRGKEDWDGTDLPGEGAKEDRTKPTTSTPNLESVSLDTSVKSLLENKTLKQIAQETDIDEQLVVEAAALGKTLGELFEADMNDKSTRGREDWDGTDLPGEGVKVDRTKPTTKKPALAEGEEEVSEEGDVDLEEAAKEVEEAFEEELEEGQLKDL